MTQRIHDPYGLSRRRFLKMSGMAAGGLLLAACGDDAGTATTSAAVPATTAAGASDTTAGGSTGTTAAGGSIPQSDLEVVRMDFNTPNPNLQAPYWVGISKGWFEEVGIDLRPENITGLDEYLPPMFAGDIDVALMDSTVLFPAEHQAVLDGNPNGLTYTSCVFGAQPVIIIAAEGVTVENLPGRTVGCARAGTTNEALTRFALGELGIDWETDVNCVNLTGGSNDWVTAMLSGQVDATLAFPRHIALAEQAGGSVLYNEPSIEPQNGWGILRSTLDEYPNFATAWLYAYIKAQQWCKDEANWEEMREIVGGEFGVDYPDETFAAMNVDDGLMTTDHGWDPNEMDELITFQQPILQYAEDLPWRDYVDLTYLHAAQEAHGLPLNPVDLNTGVTNL